MQALKTSPIPTYGDLAESQETRLFRALRQWKSQQETASGRYAERSVVITAINETSGVYDKSGSYAINASGCSGINYLV